MDPGACSASPVGSTPVIDDIIRHAGVACGSFYKHFVSLDQAMTELAVQLGEEMASGVMAIYDVLGFLQSLVEAAHVEADLGNVACQFLRWMFEAAVSDFGATRVRSTANEAGPGFSHLADLPNSTASQRQKAKIMAKQARRRGLFLPSPNEALVAEALGVALEGGGAQAGFFVHWIASLSARPVDQYGHFSRKLLTLVETA